MTIKGEETWSRRAGRDAISEPEKDRRTRATTSRRGEYPDESTSAHQYSRMHTSPSSLLHLLQLSGHFTPTHVAQIVTPGRGDALVLSNPPRTCRTDLDGSRPSVRPGGLVGS